MTINIVTCVHCGGQRDTSGSYTSPDNRARDAQQWQDEHGTGACAGPKPITTPIVQIGGWLTSGKDAFADRLVEKHGFKKLAMGELILEFMLIEDPWIIVPADVAERHLTDIVPGFHKASEIIELLGYVKAKTIPDFRDCMQRLGQAARSIIGTDAWASAMAKRLHELAGQNTRVVYTGSRFPAELNLFRSYGAASIWIDRPGVTASPDADVSELSLTRKDFDEVVENDGTLAQLHAKADAFAARLAETVP